MEKVKKLTKVEMFEIIKTHLTDADEIAFIDHEIDLLKSKNSGRKPTAKQQENEVFMADIMAFFENTEIDEMFNISEIQAQVSEVSKLSNQRMSALMKQLVDSGQLVKTYEKRKAYFSYNHG